MSGDMTPRERAIEAVGYVTGLRGLDVPHEAVLDIVDRIARATAPAEQVAAIVANLCDEYGVEPDELVDRVNQDRLVAMTYDSAVAAAVARATAPAEHAAPDREDEGPDLATAEWLARELRSNGGHVEVEQWPLPSGFRNLTETESRRIASAALAHLAALRPSPPAPEVAPQGKAWRSRYSDLITKVDEWMVEQHGEGARDDLLANLGVNGWLRIGWPPPAAPLAEGAAGDPLAQVRADDRPDPTNDGSPSDCSSTNPGFLVCTRTAGHPGQHIAGGGTHVVAVWPADPDETGR